MGRWTVDPLEHHDVRYLQKALREAVESAVLFADETGFPDIAVPAGMTAEGLPVTLSLLDQAFSEGTLLGFAYDFEQATKARVLPRHTPPLAGETLVRR